jgi:hypothetical protein
MQKLPVCRTKSPGPWITRESVSLRWVGYEAKAKTFAQRNVQRVDEFAFGVKGPREIPAPKE